MLQGVHGKEAQYTLPYFVDTNKAEVWSITLSILDKNLKPYQLSDIECTLYLKKNMWILKGYHRFKLVSPVQQKTEMAKMLIKMKR